MLPILPQEPADWQALARTAAVPAILVAAMVWVTAIVAVWIGTRPRVGRAAPPSLDRWPIGPATAALLYPPDGEVPRGAVAAVLLDLAARGVVTFGSTAGGPLWVGPAPTTGAAVLLPYEQQVLDHVAARARVGGGAVLVEALSLDSDEQARFTDAVVADARARGLVRTRASVGVRACLWLVLLAALAIAIAIVLAAQPPWVGVVIGSLLPLTLGIVVISPLGQLVVPGGAGREAAAACRALRDELARDPVVADPGLPAPGDRRPAYALALGVGTGAGSAAVLRALDAQQRGVAWSVRAGRWRQITVVRGTRWLDPLPVPGIVLVMVGSVPFFGIWALILGALVPAVISEPWGWGLPALGGGWALWALAVFLIGRWCFLSAGNLVLTPVTIVGQVVYLEAQRGGDESPSECEYYVAIDDGTTDRIKKYSITGATHAKLSYGMWLRLDVTRNFGTVLRADILPGPNGDSSG